MALRDHETAGWRLAYRLHSLRDTRPLVLGIPRGGVQLAEIISTNLGGDLDVTLVGPLIAPGRNAVVVGAVSEYGDIYAEPAARRLQLRDSDLRRLAERELEQLQRRRALYTPLRPLPNPAGRTVIVVDDTIQSDGSLLATLFSIRALHPARLVVAAAAASRKLRPYILRWADQLTILKETSDRPDPFQVFLTRENKMNDEQISQLLR